ncbi:MAG: acyl-CoA thioesterase [Actinomycetes bacterium]
MSTAQSGGAASPAGVVIERRVAWAETDASGHFHHSAVIRWVEEAEAVLQQRLGLRLFGRLPRVHYEVDYLDRLWFDDRIEVGLDVAEVGRSSVRFAFEVRRDGTTAARGVMVAVHAASPSEGSAPWPDDVRAALLESGPQRPELIG